MKTREFVGEAFEELTIDEMKMVQGSGDVDGEGRIILSMTNPPASVVSPVLITLFKKC